MKIKRLLVNSFSYLMLFFILNSTRVALKNAHLPPPKIPPECPQKRP